ncbi:hypothetical protein [Spirosoma migulaei]
MKDFTEVAIVNGVRYRFIDINFEDKNDKNPARNSSNWEVIQWVYEGKIVEIVFSKGTLLRAVPDEKHEKILVVYERNKFYAAPSNAVIYFANGSVYKILTPPILIGNLASKYDRVIKGSYFGGLYPSWFINSKTEKVIGIAIMFPPGYQNIYGDFFEVREINLETGEFGEVLQDGAV